MTWLAALGLAHAVAVAIINATPTPPSGSKLAVAYRGVEILAGVLTSLAKDTGAAGTGK